MPPSLQLNTAESGILVGARRLRDPYLGGEPTFAGDDPHAAGAGVVLRLADRAGPDRGLYAAAPPALGIPAPTRRIAARGIR